MVKKITVSHLFNLLLIVSVVVLYLYSVNINKKNAKILKKRYADNILVTGSAYRKKIKIQDQEISNLLKKYHSAPKIKIETKIRYNTITVRIKNPEEKQSGETDFFKWWWSENTLTFKLKPISIRAVQDYSGRWIFKATKGVIIDSQVFVLTTKKYHFWGILETQGIGIALTKKKIFYGLLWNFKSKSFYGAIGYRMLSF